MPYGLNAYECIYIENYCELGKILIFLSIHVRENSFGFIASVFKRLCHIFNDFPRLSSDSFNESVNNLTENQ